MDWERTQKRGTKISLEMQFYKDTFAEMDRFEKIIESDVPAGNQRLGTILLETLSLKKLLAEYPEHIKRTIKDNVLQTLDTETTHLKEELSRCKEILE